MNRLAAFIQVLALSIVVLVSGCVEEAHVDSHRAAQVNPKEASLVAEIEELGGEVTVEEDSPAKSVIGVRLTSTNVTDAWLERLKELTRLQSLSLNGTNVTDDGLRHVGAITSLQELWLYDTAVTDAGLVHLKGLPNLKKLNLHGANPALRKPGTRSTMPRPYSSRGLPRPDPLERGTNVTDAGLQHLEGLTSLQWLSLDSTNVTDAGLQHLQGLTNLGTLDLDNTNVGDAGLKHLKGLAKLQDLSLYNTKVTDIGLEHLKQLTSLQRLNLGSTLGPRGNTQVTDAGLQHLKGLTNLWYLGLWGTQVTAEGVKDLQQALPICNIHAPDGLVRALVRVHGERGGKEGQTENERDGWGQSAVRR